MWSTGVDSQVAIALRPEGVIRRTVRWGPERLGTVLSGRAKFWRVSASIA
jgi:hypothetical protein